MKKTLVTTLAVLMLVGPIAVAPASAQDHRGPQSQQQSPDQNWRNGERQEFRQNDGDNRRDRRHQWRDGRRDARWNDRDHNGYYENNRWHYGPPPSRLEGRRGVVLGYRPWQRGQRLGYYNNRYSEVDYRRHNLRNPPRGYHWVSNDNGDYLLAAIVSGVILQAVINSGHDRR